jgi:hypothetical protein
MEIVQRLPSSKRCVNITLQNARVAIISSSAAFCKEKVLKKGRMLFMESISYENELTYKLGDILNFKLDNINSQFEVKEIVKNDIPGKYYLTCSKRNLVSNFLLPLISKKPSENRDWFSWNEFFINGYLSDNLEELILIYRFYPNESYSCFETKLKQHPNYLGFNDPNYFLVAYRFSINSTFKEDIELFLQGKYSKLSKVAKHKIISFHKLSRKDSLFKILSRDEEYAKQLADILGLTNLDEDLELFSRPNPMEEFYNFNV